MSHTWPQAPAPSHAGGRIHGTVMAIATILCNWSKAVPNSRRFVIPHPCGGQTIDFSEPVGVKTLNRALLKIPLRRGALGYSARQPLSADTESSRLHPPTSRICSRTEIPRQSARTGGEDSRYWRRRKLRLSDRRRGGIWLAIFRHRHRSRVDRLGEKVDHRQPRTGRKKSNAAFNRPRRTFSKERSNHRKCLMRPCAIRRSMHRRKRPRQEVFAR